MKAIISCFVTLVLLLTVSAAAEERNSVSLFYSYLHWKTDLSQATTDDGTLDLEVASATDYKTKQGVFGLSATGVLSNRLHVDLRGTLASTTTEADFRNSDDNFKKSLSSLNDTRLQFSYSFGDGKGMGTLFFNLPTGKRKLTSEEYSLTIDIADVARKFVVRRYGQGLDIGIDWYAMPQWGNVGLTAGGGYLYRGKYQPLAADDREYKYGDEIFGALGLNVSSTPVGGSLGLSVRHYTKDKYDDNEVFQAGIATTLNGSLTYSDAFDLAVGASLLLRGKAKVKSSGDQILSDEAQKSGRNQLLLFTNAAFPTSEKMRILGRLEFTNVSANDCSRDSLEFLPKSHYLGLGGGVGYALTEALSASTLVSYYTGKIDSDLDLTGLGLTFMLTLQPGLGR